MLEAGKGAEGEIEDKFGMNGKPSTLLVASLVLEPATPLAEAVVPKERLFAPTR